MRADGKKIKVTDPEYAIVPHIMVQRNDALNMIELDIPAEPLQDYINNARKQGHRISHLAVFIAAYVRVVGEFPMLNRFIVNKRVYARNELNVGMVVLKGGKMDNGTMSKVNFDPTDSIFEVNRKINDFIEFNRKDDKSSATDKLVDVLLKTPGLLRVGVSVLKWMDWHNLLPGAIIDASPFHTTLTISNLASIRTNHIFHHIYNFGTTGVLMTMGNSREVAKRDVNDEIHFEKCIPFGVVMDERLCSGSYLAVAFRKFKNYLKDPSVLETPLEEKDVIRECPYKRTESKQ